MRYEWAKEVEAWTKKECARWAKQLGSIYDWDDLMQEAMLCYLAVKEFCDPVEEPRRFMAAYKRFVFHRFWLFKRYMHRAGEGCHASEYLKSLPSRIDDKCLDDIDMPETVGIVLGRLGILYEYRGRRYLHSRRHNNETPADFVRRLANKTGDVLGQILDYMEVKHVGAGTASG